MTPLAINFLPAEPLLLLLRSIPGPVESGPVWKATSVRCRVRRRLVARQAVAVLATSG